MHPMATMKIVLPLLAYLPLFCACHAQSPASGPVNALARWADSAGIEAKFAGEMQCTYSSLLKELGEKPLDSMVRVTYVFQLTLPYSQYYRFRIEQQADSNFILYSKAFGGATLDSKLKDSIPYRMINAQNYKSRLVEERQAFSKAEFDTFRNTLEGSYYWAWEYPYHNIGLISEGPFWSLECRDYLPQHGDTLVSHSNDAGKGVYGSFTKACLYLVQRSKLLKRLPYLAAYTKF